jgi:hypothetical protein
VRRAGDDDQRVLRRLRSRTNKQKRPYQEETITAYKVAARALDAWMTRQGMEEDFSACDTPMLNRFFRDLPAAARIPALRQKPMIIGNSG